MTQILIQPIRCLKCQHEWDLPMQESPPVEMYVNIIKSAAKYGCPNCGEHEALTLLSTRSGII